MMFQVSFKGRFKAFQGISRSYWTFKEDSDAFQRVLGWWAFSYEKRFMVVSEALEWIS